MKVVHRGGNLTVGVSLVAFGVIANPWVLGAFVTSDGGIDDPLTYWTLLIVNALAILIGAALIVRRNHIRVVDYLYSALAIVVLFVLSIVVDVSLAFFEFPAENYHKYTNAPNTEVRVRSDGEYDTHIRYNAQGFRDEVIPLKKETSSEKRVLIVGDNFAVGYGVEREEAFPALLTSRFDGVHFINAAKPGTHIESYMNAVLKRGLRYDLDGVLICVYMSDIWQTRPDPTFTPSLKPSYFGLHRILHRLYPRIYTQFAIAHHFRVVNQTEGGGAEGVVENIRRQVGEKRFQQWRSNVPDELYEDALRQYRGAHAMSILIQGLADKDYYTSTFRLDTPTFRIKWANAKAMLDFTIGQCNRHNVRVGVVFIPDAVQYDPRFFTNQCPLFASGVDLDPAWLDSDTNLQTELRQWSEESNVPYLDLTDAYRIAIASEGPPLNYIKDTHWTPQGQQVAADAIGQWLEDTAFLDFGTE